MNLLVLALGLLVGIACTKDGDSGDPENELLTKLESKASQTVSGNISGGKILGTLDWAWSSSNACFVEPAESRYQGKHIFYQIELPTNSIIKISLIPNDASTAMGLYAYSKASGNVTFPEDLNSAVTCEADPSNNNGRQTGNRSVELNAISNPYSIMIGVAGAEGVEDAGFKLEIEIES
ncbi:hypothetical protein GCM10007940_02930 [Portibacter lacus]|uniref:Uncharacterized protein n=2 Tax=Portibacter lacus TaxID=1099794 RepID=A0AA37SN53_9BACT|nr:hypothetical protein GCM10007940_02930 [Portibacter lacus]